MAQRGQMTSLAERIEIGERWAAGQWYTLTLEREILNGQVHYHRFTIDQDVHDLDVTIAPASTPDQPDHLAVAVQLDGNFQQDPYELFIDQVDLMLYPYTLTVHTAGTGSGVVTSSGGIDCGADCMERYTYGTVVTLTAAPLISSTFTGWSGAVVTTTNPVTLTMDAEKSITATFITYKIYLPLVLKLY